MKINLKQILLDLNAHLVAPLRCIPGTVLPEPEWIKPLAEAAITRPVVDFMRFLDESANARSFLQDQGVDWDGPPKKEIKDDDDLGLGDVKLTPSCNINDGGACESCQ